MPSIVSGSMKRKVRVYITSGTSSSKSLRVLHSRFPMIHLVRLSRGCNFTRKCGQTLRRISTRCMILLGDSIRIAPR